jgi:hypothetical protein
MNYRPVIILALIVAAIVGAAMWFLQTQPPVTVPAVTKPEVTFSPQAQPIPEQPSAPASRVAAGPTPVQRTQPPPVQPAAPAEWETKIDQAIRSGADEAQTAQILINMLPTLPPEGQAEAAQHITNLIEDKDYHRVSALLRNPSLPEEVHDVLVTDLMNREDPVKLPALLDVAKIPNHPHHEEALTDLQIFLDEDFGTDWAKWDAALKEYLRKQAAEEAGTAPAP